MDTFADYYAVLGVKPNASTGAIKAAFKKLALQYHPDIYKGEDAQERMRVLLLAYQTLSNPESRRTYDARRSRNLLDTPFPRAPGLGNSGGRPGSEVSPAARRDRQRHYDFPDLSSEVPVQVKLGDMTYRLSPRRAQRLLQQGMLRGIAPEASGKASPEGLEDYPHSCHRCHHRWTPASLKRDDRPTQSREPVCPSCKASDWGEYLLLRCVHCRAVFESEQIRYEIGTYNYGDRSLCPPYELFPLCPYCGASGWCPAEDARVRALRAEAKQRAILLRVVWFGVIVAVAVIVASVVFTMFR